MGLTKAQLEALNDSSFPNNNGGLITPQVLRDYNDATIANTVNQDAYTADSASFNTRINATGSFATTGSNTFNGNQNISGSIFFPNGAEIRGTAGQQTVIASNTNLSIEGATSLGITANSNLSISASNIFLQNLRYPNFDGTAGQVLSTDGAGILAFTTVSGSGGSINTGSFATTGSNSFTGNQTISTTGNTQLNLVAQPGFQTNVDFQSENSNFRAYGDFVIGNNGQFGGSGSIKMLTKNNFMEFAADQGFRMGVMNAGGNGIEGGFVTINVPSGSQQLQLTGSLAVGGNVNITGQYLVNGVPISGSGAGNISVQDEGSILGNATSFNFNGAGVTATLSAGTASITIPGGGGSIATGSFATTGSNFFVGVQSINNVPGTSVGEVYLLGRSGSLFIANNLSAAGGPSYASISHISSSQLNANTNLIFKDNSFTGSTIVSGSSNIFSNPTQAAVDRVNYIGGSSNFFLNAQSDQLPTITGSAASVSGNRPTMNGNIINGTSTWAINQAANPGTHQYSNNIIAGGSTLAFNMTGNTGTVNVNSNLGLSATMTLNSPSRSIAEINAGASGSAPLGISNNLIAGTLSYNGPVSMSAGGTHTISANSINGILNMNVQSQSRGISISQNSINGTLSFTDNVNFAPTLNSQVSIANNNIGGTCLVTNRASASMQINNNILSTWTIVNDYDASSVTSAPLRQAVINGNITFGVISNNIYLSGSSGTQARQMNNNLLGGMFISASTIASGSNGNMLATIGVGYGLDIVGTSRRDDTSTGGAGATIGSAFIGRLNKTGQGFNTTGDVILAVGTGTSGSAGFVRKTGLLIDSGSNSFFEGTVNVSGSLTVQSGSTFFANGNRQFNVGAFSSLVSQSGSANVSQSMNFEVTDISQGVSIVSNSRITLANSGTYNIQFSAQVDRVSGSGTDTVHIWLKKNGTNVSASAGAITVSGAAAAAKTISSWNYVVDAAAGDYYEIVWEPTDANLELIAAAATGNIPSIPSVILTVTQVR